jgi:hypothetical protein
MGGKRNLNENSSNLFLNSNLKYISRQVRPTDSNLIETQDVSSVSAGVQVRMRAEAPIFSVGTQTAPVAGISDPSLAR